MRYQSWLAVVALLLFGGVCALGQGQPTTLQSSDALRTQGLTKVGPLYLLETDAKLEEDLRALGKAQTLMAMNHRKRAKAEQDIQAAKDAIRQWTREYEDLNRQMADTKPARKYNELVAEVNIRRDRIKEAQQLIADREKDLQKMGDPHSDYVTLVIELSTKMEEAARKYEMLAADPRVQEALAQLNEGTTTKAKLGPSPRFAAELPHWRKERAAIDSAVIKIAVHDGVPQVEVTLNGTLNQTMVLDSGASIVTITAAVAHELGISPREHDRKIKLVVANGKEVEAKIIHLESIRLGQFTVEDVECAVLPASAKGADCLLGATFLHHFVYQMNLAAHSLQISQIHDPADEKRTRPATRPAAAGNTSRPVQAPASITAPASFTWDTDKKDAQPVRMGGEDRICFLSSIRGHFDGPDAYVGLHLAPTGDRLLEGGHSKGDLSVGGMSLAIGDKPAKWKATQYTWKQGERPVKMIDSKAGFCCLSVVGGRFEGRGERVAAYVAEDGFWYLDGQSGQKGVCASAVAYEVTPGFRYETKQFTWSQGDPPVRMIRQDEGFCYLSSMQGKFRGSAEEIRVYVGNDGWWYLEGKSAQTAVGATATAIRITGF